MIERLYPVLEPIVEAEGAYIVDMEYVREGKNWYLRLYADKPGGIGIDDCALISEQVSDALDALDPDPFPDQYFLEVASPGAERPLKTSEEIERAIGDYVHLDYYVHQHGELAHEGYLLAADKETYRLEIQIKANKKEIEVPVDAVRLIRLAVKL